LEEESMQAVSLDSVSLEAVSLEAVSWEVVGDHHLSCQLHSLHEEMQLHPQAAP
jgi:hypothetical protein